MATRLDRKGKRSRFEMARGAESRYNTQLRSLAKEIGKLVRGFGPDKPDEIIRALTEYSRFIEPWAKSVAGYMIADIDRRNERAWLQTGKDLGKNLRLELSYAPTGNAYAMLQNLQVGLIKSIPLDAAERVHMLTTEALVTGRRAADIAAEIMRTEEVSKSKATLIARTEVARSASVLTESRARFVGSEAYIWRTSRDGDVRPTHRKMEGKVVRWDSPPKTDEGLAPYHAGCGPNCRCYPEPIIP